MGKRIHLQMVLFSVGIFLVAVFAYEHSSLRQIVQDKTAISVHAGDEEDSENSQNNNQDNEDEERSQAKEKESSSSSQASTKTKSTLTPSATTTTFKTVPVTKVITTLDPQFTTDQDKDGIVDGLDPHPTVDEHAYFTDDDNDGIANVFDMHPGEDDFVFYEQENDQNGNGILDSYESMEGR